MLRKATALVLLAACTVHADTNNPETLAERSQATARAVLDRAVAAIGGAEALRAIDVVRLQSRGRNLAAAADDDGRAAVRGAALRQETLLLDLEEQSSAARAGARRAPASTATTRS